MRIEAVSLKQFAKTLYKINKSDRYSSVVVSGFMGSGKSCFMDKLAREYAKVSNTKYSVNDNMTWEREELAKWIDGDEDDETTQKEEYNVIVADELISILNRRNWYKSGQKGVIELFNKCRDRHLLFMGAIPIFQHLDGMFKSIVYFWVHVDKRGTARVYKQEENEFNDDPWNTHDNKKLIRKKKVPYSSPNFVCLIKYPDWTPKEKEEYYNVRNIKRKNTENQDEPQHARAHDSVKQRNELIRYAYNNKLIDKNQILEQTKLSKSAINQIIRGLR